ncbi:MAG: RlmE family RNA methyltransferase [Alphaproteobacteria bacterium]|nr:RlmE family RNA methyltransferase [Alphaproteobacteria bacterium]
MAQGKGGGQPPRRTKAVKVRSSRRRSASSTRWLDRQLNDPYVQGAQRAGYHSRAAFKLAEIDDRFKLLRQGMRVLDLGAAPGGWTQIAVARAGAGNVLALDREEMAEVTGARFLQGDFLEPDTIDRLRTMLHRPVDVILSDIAPSTTGHAGTDHLRIIAVAEAVLDFAELTLSEGGALVVKVFQGGAEKELLIRLRHMFEAVKHVKPPASRKESPELYVVAKGFKGRSAS